MTNDKRRPFKNPIFRFVTVLLGVWFAWDLLSHLVAEVLWFNELGYLSAYLKRLAYQLGVWMLVCVTSAGFLLGNLSVANRFKYSDTSLISRLALEAPTVSSQHIAGMNLRLHPLLQKAPRSIREGTGTAFQANVPQSSLPLNWRSFLVVVFCLSLLVGMMLLHYGKIGLSLWHRDMSQLNVTPPLPTAFDWTSVQTLVQQPWNKELGQIGVLVVVVVALIVNSQFWLTAIASVLSLFFALVLSTQWSRILLYFYPTFFEANEPLFGRDISFYIFSFPVWQLFDFWLGGLFLFGLVAVLLIYLLAGESFSHGKFPGFSQSQLRHLYALGAGTVAIVAVRYWLSRYELLYSTRGVTYGASYTDVTAQLPVNTALSFLTVAISLWLFVQTIFGFRHFHSSSRRELSRWECT
jgi:uncharacterized membrane protein (UPF0182 family)